MNRIDRLTAILIQLQTKRIVKAEEIADRFEISLRTVYRDMRALQEAGVPIGAEAGKGYFIVDGYHLPPVMFSQDEATALLMAGKLVEKMTDVSVKKAFESALMKIKSVLHETEKDKLDFLQSHVEVMHMARAPQQEFPDNFLNDIQRAVLESSVVQIHYFSNQNEVTEREVEPIGLFYYSFGWHLIAYCRLRNDYRDFRTDRIKKLFITEKRFENKNLKSIKDYMDEMRMCNQDLQQVSLLLEKSTARYVSQQKYAYGLVSEEDVDDRTRMTFLVGWLGSMARWILLMGSGVEIEGPEKLKTMVEERVEELYRHHSKTLSPDF